MCPRFIAKISSRGIKTLDFAGVKETVYERSDWPLPKLQGYFKNDTLALIGYGSQGHGQGLNARDNGLNVIVGVRKDGESWRQAVEDGWVSFILSQSIRIASDVNVIFIWLAPLMLGSGRDTLSHRRGH